MEQRTCPGKCFLTLFERSELQPDDCLLAERASSFVRLPGFVDLAELLLNLGLDEPELVRTRMQQEGSAALFEYAYYVASFPQQLNVMHPDSC